LPDFDKAGFLFYYFISEPNIKNLTKGEPTLAIILFFVAFAQQFLVALNIRNISTGRIRAAAVTSFLIAITWGMAVVIIASNARTFLSLIFYGFGASAGVITSILFDKYIHPKKEER